VNPALFIFVPNSKLLFLLRESPPLPHRKQPPRSRTPPHSAVLLYWVAWGFHMSFDEKMVFFLGKPRATLDQEFLLGKAFLGLFPTATTLILIVGALLGRMNIRAWMLFVPLWVTFSYIVTAFSI